MIEHSAAQLKRRPWGAFVAAAFCLIPLTGGCGGVYREPTAPETFEIHSEADLAAVAFVNDDDRAAGALSTAIEQARQPFGEQVSLRIINAAQTPKWMQVHGLTELPTVCIFRHGAEVVRWTGLIDRHTLGLALRQNLERFEPTGPVAITLPIVTAELAADRPDPSLAHE